MKVKILSGNSAGTVVEMTEVQAEVSIQTGFAEKYVEPEQPEAAVEVEPQQ